MPLDRYGHQMSNRGQQHTLDGRSQCLKHWAREFNMPYATVLERVGKGWDLREALTTIAGGHSETGISAAWRQWIMAPVLTVK